LSWPNRIWNAFQAHFFKRNATENQDAEVTARRIALADSAPTEYLRNRQAYEDWLEKDGPHLSVADIYNPMGETLVGLSVAQKDTYTLRAYDVAAYQRLVSLVFQLKRQHIAPAAVAAFMTAHADWSTHPVDGKPFHWDETSGEIAVNTLGDRRKEQRFSIVLQ
jgi:N-acetyl-anhydromuramyl-L-alanine amidase AmpD